MKQFISILLVVSIFTSCASTNRIIETNDSKKDITGFRLVQDPKAHSAEKSRNTLINQFFKIQTTYLFEERENQNPVVSLEFKMKKPIQPEKIDSVMFMVLDNENIRIVSSKNNVVRTETNKTSANQTDQDELITNQFIIPENLWLSVANSKSIVYRLSSGNNRIEVKPDPQESSKMKEFFSKAMQRRLEIIPLVPKGKAKW